MTTQTTEQWVQDLISRRIERHTQRIREHLASGNIERASYYADRVLCLTNSIGHWRKRPGVHPAPNHGGTDWTCAKRLDV